MKLRTVIATATTAAILASAGVAVAGASGGSTPAAAPTAQSSPGSAGAGPAARPFAAHRLRIRRLVRRGAVKIITDTIHIDRKTLRSGLAAGQTIAQIATDHGVQPQTVIDALVNAAKTKLDTAVAAGRIKPERAATIEAKLPDRIAKLVNTWHPKHLGRHASTGTQAGA